MTTAPNQAQKAFDEADFKQRLTDEYKILQDKIDKIGGFRFTIKGWSVTAVIAASAAGSTSHSLLTVVMISLGLAIMLGFFFSFELEQVRLSRLFGDRARTLEKTFRILDRTTVAAARAPISVPYTAHEIGQMKYRESQSVRRASRTAFQLVDVWQELAGFWHVLSQAHIMFYIVLIALSFFPLLPHRGEISNRLKQLRNGTHHAEPAGFQQPGVPEC